VKYIQQEYSRISSPSLLGLGILGILLLATMLHSRNEALSKKKTVAEEAVEAEVQSIKQIAWKYPVMVPYIETEDECLTRIGALWEMGACWDYQYDPSF
jgi:hypothetical protein